MLGFMACCRGTPCRFHQPWSALHCGRRHRRVTLVRAHLAGCQMLPVLRAEGPAPNHTKTKNQQLRLSEFGDSLLTPLCLRWCPICNEFSWDFCGTWPGLRLRLFLRFDSLALLLCQNRPELKMTSQASPPPLSVQLQLPAWLPATDPATMAVALAMSVASSAACAASRAAFAASSITWAAQTQEPTRSSQ